MPSEERGFGPEHPATLMDRHGLAHWTEEAGDAAGARDSTADIAPLVKAGGRPRTTRHPLIAANIASLTGEAWEMRRGP